MDDIIDINDTLTLVDHRHLAELIIELDNDDSVFITETDDGIVYSNSEPPLRLLHPIDVNTPNDNTKPECSSYTKHSKKKKSLEIQKKKKRSISKENRITLGDCPICYDELGRNALASTKCGHVYCMKCIEQHLLNNKNCPTCRKPLKSSSSYHPLYVTSL